MAEGAGWLIHELWGLGECFSIPTEKIFSLTYIKARFLRFCRAAIQILSSLKCVEQK